MVTIMLKIICFKIVVLTLFVLPATAQDINNGNFELWEDTLWNEKPVGWTSRYPGFRKTTDAYSGQYAAEIYTWYTGQLGSFVSGNNLEATWQNDFLKYGGFKLTKSPLRLTGYYKLTDVRLNVNNVFAQALLKKFNQAQKKIDTVQFINQEFLPADNYTFFEIPFIYPTNIKPD